MGRQYCLRMLSCERMPSCLNSSNVNRFVTLPANSRRGWPLLAKLKEADSLEKHLLLKKLRDALEAIRGHVTDENKDDVEVFLAMTTVWNQRRWKCYSPSIYLASKTLAFESERDRIAAIRLAQGFAFDCNFA
ncbi:hypothetical protein Nepgr_001814 [Nepenthes gracilis]|uniref:Uncharacterized protein n=1 Tax=Nepenthes gracilis TaxID=150966 RepID=A0AAD3RY14_NEPGR|nr:hypothetical protein Nepgr_001814 [Nepenthes gracilis]